MNEAIESLKRTHADILKNVDSWRRKIGELGQDISIALASAKQYEDAIVKLGGTVEEAPAIKSIAWNGNSAAVCEVTNGYSRQPPCVDHQWSYTGGDNRPTRRKCSVCHKEEILIGKAGEMVRIDHLTDEALGLKPLDERTAEKVTVMHASNSSISLNLEHEPETPVEKSEHSGCNHPRVVLRAVSNGKIKAVCDECGAEDVQYEARISGETTAYSLGHKPKSEHDREADFFNKRTELT